MARLRSSVAWRVLSLCLAVSLSSASLDQLHHAGEDDAACLVPLATEDGSNHRVGGTLAHEAAPDHCFLCHWARGFHAAARSAQRPAVTEQATVTIRPWWADVLAAAPYLSRLPARAPPA
ncbi:MAG: hypothetical protein FJW23_04715 [Acidimicrobiia bacterium]|nr:hypothetical protein [Acidimicrobiia bacterium]